MKRTYRYRLYPTPPQERALNALMFHSKRLYNVAYVHRELTYQATKNAPSWQQQCRLWVTDGRKVDDGLALLPYDTASYVIQRLDKAYRAFFQRLKDGIDPPGYPKRMRFCNTLEYKYPSAIQLRAVKVDSKSKHIQEHRECGKWTRLYLMNVGEVRCRYHRRLPEIGRISYASVTCNRIGQWHVQLAVEEESCVLPPTGKAIGIDIGLVYALALSDGTTFHPTRYYETSLQEQRRLKRKLDRQRRANNPDCYDAKGKSIKGKHPKNKSRHMKKTDWQHRRFNARLARLRREWLHQITDWLTREYDFIAIEDLSPQFMIKNKYLALKALDISFSRFRILLEYKAAIRGKTVVAVPAAYSSQTCSACGSIKKEHRLSQSRFVCSDCGYVENADINAAKVILLRGLDLVSNHHPA